MKVRGRSHPTLLLEATPATLFPLRLDLSHHEELLEMKRLAFFTLEGRLRQGPHEVWITLGRYATSQLARGAAESAVSFDASIMETRVVPFYRVSEPFSRQLSQITSPGTPPAIQESVTVA